MEKSGKVALIQNAVHAACFRPWKTEVPSCINVVVMFMSQQLSTFVRKKERKNNTQMSVFY